MIKKRRRIPVHRSDRFGAPPGTLTAPADAVASRLSVLAYGPDSLVEESGVGIGRVKEFEGKLKFLKLLERLYVLINKM